MGVDLTLLPVAYETDEGTMVCTVAMDLDLSRVIAPFYDLDRYPITTKIVAPLAEIPERIASQLSGEERYFHGGPWDDVYFGPINEDGYQGELTFVLAGDVKRAFEANSEALVDINDTELAAIRYLSALNDKTKIVLYFW